MSVVYRIDAIVAGGKTQGYKAHVDDERIRGIYSSEGAARYACRFCPHQLEVLVAAYVEAVKRGDRSGPISLGILTTAETQGGFLCDECRELADLLKRANAVDAGATCDPEVH